MSPARTSSHPLRSKRLTLASPGFGWPREIRSPHRLKSRCFFWPRWLSGLSWRTQYRTCLRFPVKTTIESKTLSRNCHGVVLKGWDIGPLRPAFLYSDYSLRDELAFRISGGIAPPNTRPWPNHISPPAMRDLPRPRRLGRGGI